MTNSILQCGMSINDALGTALLLDTLLSFYWLALMADDVRISYWNPAEDMIGTFEPFLEWTLVMPTVLECLLFAFFVWIAFVAKGRGGFLKAWMVLSTILILVAQSTTFVYYAMETGERSSMVKLVLLEIARLLISLMLIGYIFGVYFLSLGELSKGGDLRGFGRGIPNLCRYYRNKYRRLAIMILVTEIIWNLWIAIDIWIFSILYSEHAGDSESNPDARFGVPIRMFRVFFAMAGLSLVKRGRMSLLKFCWLPLLLLVIVAGAALFVPIMLAWLEEETYGRLVHFTPFAVYLNEVITSLILGIALSYWVTRFVFQQSIRPQPLVCTENVECPQQNVA